jgi:hypothetical protein
MALLVWVQGARAPVDQRVDEDLRVAPWPNPAWQLPDQFSIYSHDCNCPYPVEAICQVKDGVWTNTELISLSSARQGKHETRAQWASRRTWLARGQDV